MQTLRITSWGNSQGIRLGKPILDEAGMGVGDLVTVRVEGTSVVITPVRHVVRPANVDKLFADYEGNHKPKEDGFAGPVGSEVL